MSEEARTNYGSQYHSSVRVHVHLCVCAFRFFLVAGYGGAFMSRDSCGEISCEEELTAVAGSRLVIVHNSTRL